MNHTALVVVSVVVSTLFACGPIAERPPDETVTARSAALTSYESAQAIADYAISAVRAHPNATPEQVMTALRQPLAQLEELSLTAAQQQSLRDHMLATGPDVVAIIQGWGQTNATYAFQSPGLPPPAGGCLVYCLLFFLVDCNTGNLVGGCFGAWDCTAGTVVECNDGSETGSGSDAECPHDFTCPAGYRCATWAFKPNECVKTCDDDSDCPGDQKCKKPLGTSFKRCK